MQPEPWSGPLFSDRANNNLSEIELNTTASCLKISVLSRYTARPSMTECDALFTETYRKIRAVSHQPERVTWLQCSLDEYYPV